jgi:tetratricopeptide (TPR) repeat protein
VANILEGSVRKSGDKIRVTAQLVKVADGFHLWSETYDRTLDDIFAVQDDIARSVAQALEVTLLGQAKEKEKRPDAEAYDLVLQARFVMQTATRDSVRRAREMLERALALSPDYAPAWAEMGLSHGREVELANTSEERRRATERMREALAKALALDPNLAVTHSRMALVHLGDWDFAAARDSADKAVAADPKNPIPLANAATVYSCLGKDEQAIALLERAVEADPLNSISLTNLSTQYVDVGRLDEAETLCRRAIELRPDHPGAYVTLGTIRFLQGKLDEARASFDEFGRLAGQENLVRLFSTALIEHALGHHAASDAAVAEFEQRYGKADPYASAQIRACRGESDAAFAWLDRAVAARDPIVSSIRNEPLLRSLHADPRWKALLKKIGLPNDGGSTP